MDCSRSVRFLSSVAEYRQVAAPTRGSRKGEMTAAQIIGPNAHVAVCDDEIIVLRFSDQAREARDFVVYCIAAGAEQQADAALGKIADEFFEHRERGVAWIHAKNYFVIGIILKAEAGVIFVGFRVETFHRLEAADGRSEIGIGNGVGARGAEIADRAVEREEVVDEGDCGEG